MGLEHEFFLISKEMNVSSYSDWYSTNRHSWNEKVEIEDSIIRYITDTLRWVPSYLAERNQEYHGLDYYGETIIDQTGAGALSKILQGWIEIFSVSPDKFKLQSELTSRSARRGFKAHNKHSWWLCPEKTDKAICSD